jgi:hypothetical protein
MHEAVLTDSIDGIRQHLPRTSPEDIVNFLGQSPLHVAVGNIEIMRLLLRAGYGIDATDVWGNTPLMYAATMDCQEAVLLLLSEEADPVICGGDCQLSFLDYALECRYLTLFSRAMEMLQEQLPQSRFQLLVRQSIVLPSLIYTPIHRVNGREEASEVLFGGTRMSTSALEAKAELPEITR